MAARMPFGKHVGELITELDSGYLCWVLERADRPPAWLKDAIRDELRSRFGSSSPPPPPDTSSWRKPCPDPKLATKIIATGLRTLAHKHHPDRGGDTATMQRLNAAADWLKGTVPQ